MLRLTLGLIVCLSVLSYLAPAQTTCSGGFAGSFPCSNVDLMSTLSVTQLSPTATSGNDNWGWTDPLNGREYVLAGLDNGTAFVDITVPTAPVVIGHLPAHNVSSAWRGIKVARNHAFIVSEAAGHGLQVFDLTRLRGLTGSPTVTFTETAHYDRIGSAHNVAVNEATGFVYVVGAHSGDTPCEGGLHMVNISTPASPTFAGCFSADGYTHDAQCVNYTGPDTTYSGRELCFASNEDTVTIVDVTNKSAPAQLSRKSYVGYGYVHQGWLTEDQRFFLVDDELDEVQFGLEHNTRTHIFDVSDVDAPRYVGFHDASTRAIDHNLYIRGSFAYQSNYTAGLRILDVTDVSAGALREVAFFDVFPDHDEPGFHGTWNNYPYFNSGVVAISGIEQGLIVVRPNLSSPGSGVPPPGPDFEMAASPAKVTVSAGQTANYSLWVNPKSGPSATVSFSCSGLPAGATCTFAPSSMTLEGGALGSQLTISTAATSSAKISPVQVWLPLLAVGLVLLPNKRRSPITFLLLFMVLGTMLSCGGSNGGGNGGGTPAPNPQTQNFTVTITGDAGGVQHTASVTLSVQ